MKKIIKKGNKTKTVEKNNKKPKIKKIKEKKSRKIGKKIGNILLILITIFAIICFLGIIGFSYYIVKNAPDFNPDELYNKEATLVYDASGELIATLGVEKREKITYDELSDVLIDAIIATEDSRFFQHNGFDLPRFLKASAGQLLGNSGAGGASTLTMQVSKNTFTSVTASGIKGIIRKFTDIYLAVFKIEHAYTKEEILEFYVNAPYLGSSSYGVEQACQTYFGKSASDISLPEAALIAGLFQSPGAYDPFNNPEAAEARRNVVLNLMVRHGYITESEKEAAKAVSIEDMLVGNENKSTNVYQGFIDTVVVEVQEKTGNDPYQIPMEIYSTMVKSKQDVINNFYKNFSFADKKVQTGIAVIDNKTGAVIAVGAGRNKTGELSYNYSTMIKRHPGSTAKPLFDYGPGFEYEKWSTYTPFFDSKTYYSSGKSISNWNGKYSNAVTTLDKCLVQSKNTCAVQAFQRLDNSKIYDFITSLGIKPESDSEFINEAHALGAFTGVNPVQLAAAYSAFATGGYFTEPYTVKKIVYRDTDEANVKETYETNVKKTKVMSAQTAYLITNILYDVTPSSAKISSTNIATKTGTSTYDDSLLKSLGIRDAIRDSWVASYSPDYTMTMWYGYDELNKEYKQNKWYTTFSKSATIRKNIQVYLNKRIYEKNSKFTKPSGIVSSKVELETIPAQLPSDYTPSSMIETHYFISGTEPTEVSSRYSKLSNPLNVTLSESGNTVTLNWESPGTPSAINNEYLLSYYESGYGSFAEYYYKKRITYNNKSIGTFGFDIYLSTGTTTKKVGFTNNTTYTINLSEYTGTYDAVIVKSAYSIFKKNASSGVTKYLSSYEVPSTVSVSVKNETLSLNNSWKGASSDDISSIVVNGNTITQFELIGTNSGLLTISSIKKDNATSSINEIHNTVGNYNVTYSITFSCTIDGVIKQFTQSATQNVTVQ